MNGTDVLRKIGSGYKATDFEWYSPSLADWQPLSDDVTIYDLTNKLSLEFRFARKMHVVNGHTVPAPIQRWLFNEDPVYVASIETPQFFYKTVLSGSEFDRCLLERGLCFLTEGAAVANALARLGYLPADYVYREDDEQSTDVVLFTHDHIRPAFEDWVRDVYYGGLSDAGVFNVETNRYEEVEVHLLWVGWCARCDVRR